jgi:hypothetical protein
MKDMEDLEGSVNKLILEFGKFSTRNLLLSYKLLLFRIKNRVD